MKLDSDREREGSMYSDFWPRARLKCVLRGTSCPSLELPRPAEVAHSRRSCEGGLFSLLNGCFCFRGVYVGGRLPFLLLLLLPIPPFSPPLPHVPPVSQPSPWLLLIKLSRSPSFKPHLHLRGRGGATVRRGVATCYRYKVMANQFAKYFSLRYNF